MKKISSFAAALAVSTVIAPFAAFAQDTQINTTVTSPVANVTASAGAMSSTTKRQAHMSNRAASASNEITLRIAALTKLQTKINNEKRLSDTQRSSFTTTISTTISNLTALNIKIQADTDPAVLAADKASIKKAYRVYALLIPQTNISASSDSQLATVATMQTQETKLQARIAALKARGIDTSVQEAAYADFTTQLAAVTTSANAATTGIMNLLPDNGDKTILASNTAALKAGRVQIHAGAKSLAVARADAKIINKSVNTTANTTSTITH